MLFAVLMLTNTDYLCLLRFGMKPHHHPCLAKRRIANSMLLVNQRAYNLVFRMSQLWLCELCLIFFLVRCSDVKHQHVKIRYARPISFEWTLHAYGLDSIMFNFPWVTSFKRKQTHMQLDPHDVILWDVVLNNNRNLYASDVSFDSFISLYFQMCHFLFQALCNMLVVSFGYVTNLL